MSLVEHKKDGWTSLPPMAGAAAAAAYTGGQAEFTKALLASKTAYAWQCNACGFHAFALPGEEASKKQRWRNARDIMCKHDRRCERGSSAAAAAAPEAADTAAAAQATEPTTAASVEMPAAVETARTPRVGPACPPCAPTTGGGASTSTTLPAGTRVMVRAPGGRAKHILPGQIVSAEEDGRLLVALDDEREGECVRSPECVRRMTEQEEWQNAMAAAESAPACQMPALWLMPPSALTCSSCAYIQAVLSYIQERRRRSARRRHRCLRQRWRRSALSEPPGASGLRARAKRLNPLPARRNHLAWRVVWRGA